MAAGPQRRVSALLCGLYALAGGRLSTGLSLLHPTDRRIILGMS